MMHLLSVLPLALSASAFLVPAQVEPVRVKTLPAFAGHETVTLECRDCPSSINTLGNDEVLATGQTNLKAEVQVSQNRILFNGQQIYPPSNGIPLTITNEIVDTKGKKELIAAQISSSIEYKPIEYLSDGENELFIHPVSVEVLALQDTVVHAESVDVMVAEVDGQLALLPSRIRAYEPSPFTESCSTVWCRVKGTIAEKYSKWQAAAVEKVKSWKGCTGKKQPGYAHGKLPIKGGPAKYGGSLRPGPKGEKPQHGHHGHHHKHHHGFGAFVRYMLHAVLFPAFFGLSAGMVIGAFSWLVVNQVRRIRAARQGQYIVIEQVEVEEGRGDLPPKYEETYRAPQEETEDEKKELLQ